MRFGDQRFCANTDAAHSSDDESGEHAPTDGAESGAQASRATTQLAHTQTQSEALCVDGEAPVSLQEAHLSLHLIHLPRLPGQCIKGGVEQGAVRLGRSGWAGSG